MSETETKDSCVPNRPAFRNSRGDNLLSTWLSYCLHNGWPKSSLDKLEEIWWTYRDGYGNWKAKQCVQLSGVA